MPLTNLDKLQAILQFLAMPPDAQAKYLPPPWPRMEYMLDDTGDTTDNPVYYFTYKSWELYEGGIGTTGDWGDCLNCIWTVLTIMLDGTYSYIWHVHDDQRAGSGPADGLWPVLRRLAREALALKGWPVTTPSFPAEQVVAFHKLGLSSNVYPKGKTPRRRRVE